MSSTPPPPKLPQGYTFPLRPYSPGYSPMKPQFQLPPAAASSSTSRTSTAACYSGSSSYLRRMTNPSTPATTPRKGVGQKERSSSGSGRPVTAPGNSQSPRMEQPRPKTPRRRATESSGGSAGGGQQRSSRSAPRPRTVATLLPPRRISSVSSASDKEAEPEPEEQVIPSRPPTPPTPVKIGNLHFASSYTPHKRHWVKKALEALGGKWVTEGKITNEQLVSEEFEEKMAVLYDLAMAKKHESIDRLVNEEVEGKRGEYRKKKGIPPASKKAEGKVEDGGEPEVQSNFPFAEHLNGTVKASMSEALLRIMMRGDDVGIPDAPKKSPKKKEKDTKERDRGDATKSPKGHPPSPKEKEDTSASSNSFEKSLKKRKRSLVQCYVIDGKLIVGTKDKMLSIGGSVVNKFGESSLSRARRQSQDPSSPPNFWRSTANMMGFLPHEVTIRYCKSSRQLIISAARPSRGADNARQVQETITVPKSVDISSGSVVVLRTCRGSLIIEEAEEPVEVMLEKTPPVKPKSKPPKLSTS